MFTYIFLPVALNYTSLDFHQGSLTSNITSNKRHSDLVCFVFFFFFHSVCLQKEAFVRPVLRGAQQGATRPCQPAKCQDVAPQRPQPQQAQPQGGFRHHCEDSNAKETPER